MNKTKEAFTISIVNSPMPANLPSDVISSGLRSLFFSLLLCLPISVTAQNSANAKCIYASLLKLNKDFESAHYNISRVREDVVGGVTTPDEHDFEILSSIIADIRKGKLAVSQEGKIEELDRIVKELGNYTPGDYYSRRLRETERARLRASEYRPMEYALKRQYQHLLWELNKELPAGFKIRGIRVPPDPRPPILIKEAEALVKRQGTEYAKIYSKSGFRNEAELKDAIRSSGDRAKGILDMVENERVEFAMRAPEDIRWWVPRVGFQNQFVTKTSVGARNPEARLEKESAMSFSKRSDYAKTDNELKPKYGYLRPKENEALSEPKDETKWYGKDVYVFKKESLSKRTTFTIGDSLDYGRGEMEWYKAFVPWKDRTLMVPAIVSNNDGYLRPGNPAVDSNLGRLKSGFSKQYIELQYWGPVGLDDVESFEFSSKPPAGEFLKELRNRGIKIIDGRLKEKVVWVPGK